MHCWTLPQVADFDLQMFGIIVDITQKAHIKSPPSSFSFTFDVCVNSHPGRKNKLPAAGSLACGLDDQLMEP